jgi:hypothetical protein
MMRWNPVGFIPGFLALSWMTMSCARSRSTINGNTLKALIAVPVVGHGSRDIQSNALCVGI